MTSTETTCCPERLNRVSSQEGKPVLGASMRQTSTGLFKSIFKGKCLLCSVHFCYLIFLVAEGFPSAEARKGAFQLPLPCFGYCSFYIPFPDKHEEEICRSHQLNREKGVERVEDPSQVQGSALLGSRGKAPWVSPVLYFWSGIRTALMRRTPAEEDSSF